MKRPTYISVFLFLFSIYSSAQTFTDRKKIYELVIETFITDQIPIMNETFARIYKYNIDGNYDKWFYRGNNQESVDTSLLVVRIICVNPIKYSQPVNSFLDSQNIATKKFTFRADNSKLDSLRNYISNERIISWKRAPLGNSIFKNIFRKKEVYGFSDILFDIQNEIALVKMQVYAKNKLRSKNPSKIIILTNAGMDWKVIGSIDEKHQGK